MYNFGGKHQMIPQRRREVVEWIKLYPSWCACRFQRGGFTLRTTTPFYPTHFHNVIKLYHVFIVLIKMTRSVSKATWCLQFRVFLKSLSFPARRKFHSFPVRRRMLSVSSVSLSGDLSREAWANLQRLVLLGSMPRWAFVSSASPRRASHEPERRDWMSAFLKGRSHRCLSRTLSSPRQPSANQQNPAWESYRGRASCDSVVWKEGAVFLLLLFFFCEP